MKHRWAAATLVVAVLVAGCSATAGTPTTPSLPADSPTPTASHTSSGAPPVATPLLVDHFLDEPCTSLTKKQIAGYLGKDTEVELDTEYSSGPSCSWYSDLRSNASISITYPQLSDEGLTAIYRNRNKAAYFTEMDSVDGYPTIASSTIDNRDEGECLVTVGTSNSDYVNIRVYLGDGSVGKVDPCEAAHEVATAVIGNIKAANGGK
ncbi:DUF3558 domain-containing protein [Saccharomonospora xinjiangensis]|uniref:DUF3558 domain-containing protein n=1 Tax=Saccharomonospora xinjiangensis TaxID=75294 RepID=UPI00106F2A34|nr:DUF3558 domain-containing protein [Saccharomonospora xinjiangensis]QBQ58759.1 hypothetical protein EYD13_01860 [Saccharomonospora xinjiangensis]